MFFFKNDKKKIFPKRVELFVDGDVSDNEFILVPEALLLVRLKTLGTFIESWFISLN